MLNGSKPEARHPGRPRCEHARQAIIKSTLQLLDADGFSSLSIEGIAARAGVGKATIYRWWPNKAALVAEAFLNTIEKHAEFPDTGSIREDIRIQMRHLAKVLLGRRGRIQMSLIMGGQEDPELLEAYRARFLEPRRKVAREIIRRAARRGELRADIDPDLALDALYAPILQRVLIKHQSINNEFIDRLCDYVINGLRATARSRRARRAIRYARRATNGH